MVGYQIRHARFCICTPDNLSMYIKHRKFAPPPRSMPMGLTPKNLALPTWSPHVKLCSSVSNGISIYRGYLEMWTAERNLHSDTFVITWAV